MNEPDHSYSVWHTATGWRVLRDGATSDERGLHMGEWVKPDEAEQRWSSPMLAAAALMGELARESESERK